MEGLNKPALWSVIIYDCNNPRGLRMKRMALLEGALALPLLSFQLPY